MRQNFDVEDVGKVVIVVCKKKQPYMYTFVRNSFVMLIGCSTITCRSLLHLMPVLLIADHEVTFWGKVAHIKLLRAWFGP
jgi:hypothetical protein